MATIISFADVYSIEGVMVIFDLDKRIHFDFILPTDNMFCFKSVNSILFNFDTDVDSSVITKFYDVSKDSNKFKRTLTEYVGLQTINDRKPSYKHRYIKMADNARIIQEIIIFPSDTTIKVYVRRSCINNMNVTTKDIDHDNDIYGPSASRIKGKDVRPKATSHQQTIHTPVPPRILSEYRNLKLFIDIIYVSSLPFLITGSMNINLRSV